MKRPITILVNPTPHNSNVFNPLCEIFIVASDFFYNVLDNGTMDKGPYNQFMDKLHYLIHNDVQYVGGPITNKNGPIKDIIRHSNVIKSNATIVKVYTLHTVIKALRELEYSVDLFIDPLEDFWNEYKFTPSTIPSLKAPKTNIVESDDDGDDEEHFPTKLPKGIKWVDKLLLGKGSRYGIPKKKRPTYLKCVVEELNTFATDVDFNTMRDDMFQTSHICSSTFNDMEKILWGYWGFLHHQLNIAHKDMDLSNWANCNHVFMFLAYLKQVRCVGHPRLKQVITLAIRVCTYLGKIKKLSMTKVKPLVEHYQALMAQVRKSGTHYKGSTVEDDVKLPNPYIHLHKKGYFNLDFGKGMVMKSKKKGYQEQRVIMGVHVFLCWVFNGPQPKGHEVGHLCGHPNCINPSHLHWCTRAENYKVFKWHKVHGRGSVYVPPPPIPPPVHLQARS